LTYKLWSLITLKSSSDFNLYSWRVPLFKLCLLFLKALPFLPSLKASTVSILKSP
jgi:hypothetical protein